MYPYTWPSAVMVRRRFGVRSFGGVNQLAGGYRGALIGSGMMVIVYAGGLAWYL